MFIREATLNDNEELQQLQIQCPQGTSLIVSTVNTPDFFARAKAYESYKVYVAWLPGYYCFVTINRCMLSLYHFLTQVFFTRFCAKQLEK